MLQNNNEKCPLNLNLSLISEYVPNDPFHDLNSVTEYKMACSKNTKGIAGMKYWAE